MATRVVVKNIPDEISFKNLLPPIQFDNYRYDEPYFRYTSHELAKAYLTFNSYDEVMEFKKYFDELTMIDSEGISRELIVELATIQPTLIKKEKKMNKKVNTLAEDNDYLNFLKELRNEADNLLDNDNKIEDKRINELINEQLEKGTNKKELDDEVKKEFNDNVSDKNTKKNEKKPIEKDNDTNKSCNISIIQNEGKKKKKFDESKSEKKSNQNYKSFKNNKDDDGITIVMVPKKSDTSINDKSSTNISIQTSTTSSSKRYSERLSHRNFSKKNWSKEDQYEKKKMKAPEVRFDLNVPNPTTNPTTRYSQNRYGKNYRRDHFNRPDRSTNIKVEEQKSSTKLKNQSEPKLNTDWKKNKNDSKSKRPDMPLYNPATRFRGKDEL
ncbi:hypothetical protein SNEBB_010864 [Seison nebaliae]|nr:hypothetical protein SNEBB_010864 [Seison nebaliae]